MATLVDSFDRADGPLGDPWYSDDGSEWAIDSGEAILVSEFPGLIQMVLGPGMQVAIVEAEVQLPEEAGWTVGVSLNYPGVVGEMCLVTVSSEGQVALHGPFGEPVDAQTLSSTPGPGEVHVLGLYLSRQPGYIEALAFWNGWVAASGAVSLAESAHYDPGLASTTPALRFNSVSVEARPLDYGELDAPPLTGGIRNIFPVTTGVPMGSITAPALDGGIAPPPDPFMADEVFLGSVSAPELIGGIRTTWINEPPADRLLVEGYEDGTTSLSCRPTMNGPGDGDLTTLPPGPQQGDVLIYKSGGSAVFTGIVDSVRYTVASSGEESDQLVSATVPGLLGIEWADTVVLPDFGAFDTSRLGQPAQDDREFGWPMNGMLPDSVTFRPSVGAALLYYGTGNEVFPLPDNWPDATARWMWDRPPDRLHAPRGWCYFRVAFNSEPGEHALFLCAYDYAEVWVDGVRLGVADQPGTTVRVELDLSHDAHLWAIAAFNAGGKGGVLATIMPKTTNGLGGHVMNSRSNWKTLSYPRQRLRATVGMVLHRLVREARARRAPAGTWQLAFTEDADSNGVPWPTAESIIVVKVGTTYLDVLNQLAEDRIDFIPAPGGRTLYAFVKDRGGRAVDLPWVSGVDAESIELEVGGH